MFDDCSCECSRKSLWCHHGLYYVVGVFAVWLWQLLCCWCCCEVLYVLTHSYVIYTHTNSFSGWHNQWHRGLHESKNKTSCWRSLPSHILANRLHPLEVFHPCKWSARCKHQDRHVPLTLLCRIGSPRNINDSSVINRQWVVCCVQLIANTWRLSLRHINSP